MQQVAYVTEAEVLDHLRVDSALVDDLLSERVNDVVERRVLQATFASFSQGRPDGTGDNDIVRVLLGAE